MSVPALEDLDKQTLLHPFTSIAEHQVNGPHIFATGKGIRVTDSRGLEYIDGMAGLWCVNVGYGRAEIGDAMAAQINALSYFHSFMCAANEPSILLANRLSNLFPGESKKVFFGCTGSDANDTQIKLVWQYNNLLGKPHRKKIISRQGSYHGVTVGAASMSGLPHLHAHFDVPLDRFLHTAKPHHYWGAEPGESEREFSARLAADLESLIVREGPDTVAAFIMEPVMGAGGVIPPPEGYFDAVLPVVKKYGLLLISDEVVCGFGRLGRWSGAEYFGFTPDLATYAKGLTSGYAPLSACVIADHVWQVFKDASLEAGPFGHGYTYSAHPVCAAAAMANLDIIDRENLVAHAEIVGMHFQQRLREKFSSHPLVGEVRGIGLIAGIEIVADKKRKQPWILKLALARRLSNHARAHGVICRPIYNTIAFSPPLIVTIDDVEEIIDRFSRGLNEFEAAIRADGTWKP